MRDLYAKESCIIIGRLSDYVLHDEPDVLSVFIYAPESFRIDNIMKKHHISAKEAKKLVRKMDAARNNYAIVFTPWENGAIRKRRILL